MSVKYTPLGGTHDWQRGEWFWCDSPFAAWMRMKGFECRRRNGPFWSGILGGVPVLKTKAWEFGASVLKEWMEEHLPVGDRNLITVSHGGQVAFLALAKGLQVNSLVTITMPQRADMESVYLAAKPDIAVDADGHPKLTNVHSSSLWKDRWQILGTVLDGAFRFRRTMALPGYVIPNIGIDVGHTELVRTNKMVLLETHGVLARVGP